MMMTVSMSMLMIKSLYVYGLLTLAAVTNTKGFSSSILSPIFSSTTTTSSTTSSTDTCTTITQPPPPAIQHQHPNIAIILNTNARQVTADLIPLAQAVLGKDAVYCTTTAEEAQQAAEMLIQQHVSLVVPVGGDGTLSSMIHYLTQSIIRQQQAQQQRQQKYSDSNSNCCTRMTVDEAVSKLPTMAYIPMGTGNGVGSVVACRAPPPPSMPKKKNNNNNNNTLQKQQPQQRPPSLFRKIFRRKALQQERFVEVLKLLQTVGNDLAAANKNNNKDMNTDMDISGSTSTTIPTHSTHNHRNVNVNVDLVELPMLEITTMTTTTPNQDPQRAATEDGVLCFFAGVGFDSLMLQDFKDLKDWSVRRSNGGNNNNGNRIDRWLRDTLGSVTGYVVALVAKTLPQCIRRNAHQIDVEITSTDPHALWIDHRRGDMVRNIMGQTSSSGVTGVNNNNNDDDDSDAPTTTTTTKQPTATLVYKGTAGIVAAGTSPFYGGGLRLFPFARMTLDKMHLRVGRIHPLRGFLNIPRIFRGSYRDTRPDSFGCLDFLANEFVIKVHNTGVVADVDDAVDVDSSTTTTTTDGIDNNNNAQTTQKGYPLQHSGESVGHCEQFRLRVVPAPVKFVTFFKKRVVDDTLPS
jgi:hypothetical protein